MFAWLRRKIAECFVLGIHDGLKAVQDIQAESVDGQPLPPLTELLLPAVSRLALPEPAAAHADESNGKARKSRAAN